MKPEDVFPEISILSPVYKNRETLEELHRRITSIMIVLDRSYEIILINDACPNGSIDEIKRISGLDEHTFGVDIPFNLGQQKAYLVGFKIARGELIITMDADLQDPPEAIADLIREIDKGYDVVFAGRAGKYESQSRLFFSKIYKIVLHWLTGIPADAGLYLVLRRYLMDQVIDVDPEGAHLVAVIGCLEINPSSIPVPRAIRPIGKSTFNFWMRLGMASKAIAWVVGYKLGFKRASGSQPDPKPDTVKIIHKGIEIHDPSI
jgi:glycosyltransferase involved in cell wall biosynthesis